MKDNNMVMSKNEFVKREQKVLKSMMGDRPGPMPQMKKFDAFMSNNGEYAQECARSVTKGLDKNAFPVK